MSQNRCSWICCVIAFALFVSPTNTSWSQDSNQVQTIDVVEAAKIPKGLLSRIMPQISNSSPSGGIDVTFEFKNTDDQPLANTMMHLNWSNEGSKKVQTDGDGKLVVTIKSENADGLTLAAPVDATWTATSPVRIQGTAASGARPMTAVEATDISQQKSSIDGHDEEAEAKKDPAAQAKQTAEQAKLGKEISAFLNQKVNADELFIKASTKKVQAETGVGGNQKVVFVSQGSSHSNPPFEGDFNLLRTYDDELLIATDSQLPGFQIFDDGERVIVKTAFDAEDRFSTSKLTSEMAVITDFENLIRYVERSNSIAKSQTGRSTVYQCELSVRFLKDIAPPGDGPVGISSRPLRIEAEFSVENEQLANLKLEVIRSDPLAGLRRRALENGGRARINRDALTDEDHQTEGDRWIYDFDFSSDDVPESMNSLAAEMRKAER